MSQPPLANGFACANEADGNELEALRERVKTLEALLNQQNRSPKVEPTENGKPQNGKPQNGAPTPPPASSAKAITDPELGPSAPQPDHSQAILKNILNSMGEPVIVVDKQGQALFLNPAAKALLKGESIEDGLRHWQTAHKLLKPDGQPYELEELPLIRAMKGELVDGAEMQVVSPEQNQWLSVNARPLEGRAMTGAALAVFRNITQQKQVEQALQKAHTTSKVQTQVLENTLRELQQTQARLIHGEKMASLGQTVAGIAHEINNPVNFIHGNIRHTQTVFQDLLSLIRLFQETYPSPTPAIAQTIEEIDLEFLEDDIPTMLDSMQTGTDRIREIVQSLRIFARLDEAELKAVDIHQGIESALLISKGQFSDYFRSQSDSEIDKQTGFSPIHIQKDFGDIPPLECYASQLNQVFVHLLANAIESLVEAGGQSSAIPTITLTTQATEQAITITIADNGSGIPEAIQSKIFDPFFTTKPVGQGTGLGLSICHQIVVQQHRGNLTCHSQVGKGSRFTLTLPLQLT